MERAVTAPLHRIHFPLPGLPADGLCSHWEISPSGARASWHGPAAPAFATRAVEQTSIVVLFKPRFRMAPRMMAVSKTPGDDISTCRSATAIGRMVITLLLLVGSLSTPAQAQTGSIIVTPTRVTLEPGQRAAQVYVVNRSNAPLTARISLVNRRMLEDGSLEEAMEPQPGEHFADSSLQYAPRRVHLGAGQGQTVRIMVRPPAGRPAEYRSHLLFRVEPPASGGPRDETPDGSTADESGISIRLTPVYGVTIPVIVRTGELSASSSITDLAVQRPARKGQPPRATFQLHRNGDRSVYGDIRIYHQTQGGEERLVGRTRGLAVYPPLPKRRVNVPLNQLDSDSLPPGRIRVQYMDHDNTDKVLAEAERTVP